MDDSQVNKIRVIRQKEVADIASDVLKGTDVPMPEIQASLHRLKKRYGATREIERQVIDDLLKSNLFMSRAIAQISQEVAMLTAEVAALKRVHSAGEWHGSTQGS